MISFIEESFNHGTNTEYRYTCYKREIISNYPSERQMWHLRKNLQNKSWSSAISDALFETVEHITNTWKEKVYVKKRNHLIERYQNVNKGNKIQKIRSNKSLLRPVALNLANQEIPHLKLLNLGPKFVPSIKKLPL